jgi:hypothetical protein
MQDSGYSKSYPSEEEGETRIFELKEHTNVKGFLTEDECNDIYKVLLRDEHKILRHPSPRITPFNGTTTKYETYNLLRHPDIRPYKLPQRLFALPRFQNLNTLHIQCWVNILHSNQGIQKHAHALTQRVFDDGEYKFKRTNIDDYNDFLACSVYIQGPKPSYTWYEDPKTNDRTLTRKIENIPGDLHLVGSGLMHEVKRNTHTQPRMSIAMDIHPTLDTIYERLTPWQINKRFITFSRTTV